LRGGMFLWPDLAGCPAPGVTRHRALWSADFPRHPTRGCRDCPTGLRHVDHTVNPGGRQPRQFSRRGVNAVKLTLARRAAFTAAGFRYKTHAKTAAICPSHEWIHSETSEIIIQTRKS